ncbi:uncharacterized protein BT62DRAFT_1073772 [Guyanagaster necrorhizus]|uniref:Uncharacterized protein n=1 Tax=Guyanagaster necrorhizus TaxID=856835 RepID=A0A9P8AV91_9AGAR|nr:uncharacterized protein BT62DRAFT_1073772 [Guyanagaster necrorhizus MCA 3950]KAG7449283.1 hypothetical protein BT62DRAFT_1073772 [Guyanagaster necrorhizus MCA 3950]
MSRRVSICSVPKFFPIKAVAIKPEPQEVTMSNPLISFINIYPSSIASNGVKPEPGTADDVAPIFLERGFPVPFYVQESVSSSTGTVKAELDTRQDAPFGFSSPMGAQRPAILYPVYNSASDIRYSSEDTLWEGLGMVKLSPYPFRHREALRSKWESTDRKLDQDDQFQLNDDDPYAAILGGGLCSMKETALKVDACGEAIGITPRLVKDFAKVIEDNVENLKDKFREGLEDKCRVGAAQASAGCRYFG